MLVVGGGLGGVAAALAAAEARRRRRPHRGDGWLGGQLTSQAVPPDEHPWIERFGVTARYRRLRDGIRAYYRDHYPLTAAARARRHLNPGASRVSALSHEPRVALAVLEAMLAPYRSRRAAARPARARRRTAALTRRRPGARRCGPRRRDRRRARRLGRLGARRDGDRRPAAAVRRRVRHRLRVARRDRRAARAGRRAAAEHAGGHGVLRASTTSTARTTRSSARPRYAAGRRAGRAAGPRGSSACSRRTRGPTRRCRARSRRTRPATRRASAPTSATRRSTASSGSSAASPPAANFAAGAYASDITLVNWPQNDYWLGAGARRARREAAATRAAARELSLCLLHWLQTEAPRPDGGAGWPGLRLRGDVIGRRAGRAGARPLHPRVAPHPRRVTVAEQDIAFDVRGEHGAVAYADSGRHRRLPDRPAPLDRRRPLHRHRLLPVPDPARRADARAARQPAAAAKNIATTHITNGSYRLHPVEWNVGEAAGQLAAFCLRTRTRRRARSAPTRGRLAAFQAELAQAGVELAWPPGVHAY